MRMRLLPTLAQALLLACITGTAGAAAICQPSTPAYFHKYFSGKINDRFAFKMDLSCKDGLLRGTYQYAGKGVPIWLDGQAGPGMAMAMSEVSPDGKASTGAFTGTLDGKHFRGTWVSGDGKKHWPFTAEQTSEIHIGTRREIMQAAVGDYALASVVGNGGANAMWETFKTKKGWDSNASSISRARREYSPIDLTRADLKLLDSLFMRVRPDLATELSANGKVILTILFRASGMQLAIDAPDNAQARNELTADMPPSGIANEELYLLAQEGAGYLHVLAGEFSGDLGDIVIVRYAIASDTFSVQFRPGDCCGSTAFQFKRRPPAR